MKSKLTPALGLLFVLLTIIAQATNYYWSPGTTNNNWGTLSNWWTGGYNTTAATTLPGSADNIYIGNSGVNVAMVIDASRTVSNMTFEGSNNVAITYNNSAYVLTVSVTIAMGSTGTVTTGTGNITANYLNISSGDFTAPTGTTNLKVNFNQTGGAFHGSSGTMIIGQNNGLGINGSATLFTNNGGTFDAGMGTVNFSATGSRSYYYLNIPTATTFYNVVTNISTTNYPCSVGPASGQTATVSNNLTQNNGVVAGLWSLYGNLIVNSGAQSGGSLNPGSGIITLTGNNSTTYSFTGSGGTAGIIVNKTNSSAIVTPATGTTNFTVMELMLQQGSFTAPGGTLTVGPGYYTGTGGSYTILQASGGGFNANGGTVTLAPTGSRTYFVVDPGASNPISFNNVIVNVNTTNYPCFITSTQQVLVNGNFNDNVGAVAGSWEVRGNLVVGSNSCAGGQYSTTATGTITLDGSNSTTYSYAGGWNSYYGYNGTAGLVINKSGGASVSPATGITDLCITSLTIQNGTFNAPTGTLTIGPGLYGAYGSGYTIFSNNPGGTFNPGTGTVNFEPAGTNSVFSVDVGATNPNSFYNVSVYLINTNYNCYIQAAGSEVFNVLNNAYFQKGILYSSAWHVQGNVTVSSTFNGGSSPLTFNGTGGQNFDLTGATTLYGGNITLNKASGNVTLLSALTLTGSGQSITLSGGNLVTTSTNLLTLNSGTSISAGTDNSYVCGPMKRIGSTAFTFPVGGTLNGGNHYRPVSISAPGTATDAFTAQYFNANTVTGLGTGITAFDGCEKWNLTRNTGTSQVYVSLTYNDVLLHPSCLFIPSMAYSAIAASNGTQWNSSGTSSASGNVITTTGSNKLANWGDITLAKTNPLLITQPSAGGQPGTGTIICSGSTATLGGNVTGGTPPVTYAWAPAATLSSTTGANPVASPTSSTTYSLTVTDNVGESASGTVTVNVNTSPIATAVNGGPYCSYNTIALTGGPAGMSSYSWSGPNGFTSSSQSPTNTAGGNGGAYTLQVTDGNGCTSSASTTVTVNTAPVATTSNTGPYCDYENISLSGGPDGMSSYSWSGPNSFSSTNQNPTRAASGNGGNYTVTVTDANGCTALSSTRVSVSAPVMVDVTSTDNSCNGSCDGSIVLTVNALSGTYSVQWSDNLGGADGTEQDNLCADNYCYTVTEEGGCIASSCVTINQPDAIVIQLTGTDPYCLGGNGTITSNVTGGVPPYTYQWTCSWPPNISDPTAANLTGLNGDDYFVTVTDNTSCTATSDYVINSYSQPILSVSINADNTTICSGTSATFTATPNNGGDNPTYQWFVNGNDVYDGGATFTSSSLNDQDDVYCIVTGSDPCIFQNTAYSNDIVMSVNPSPGITATVNNNVSCYGGNNGSVSLNLTGATPNTGDYILTWNPGVTNLNQLSAGSYDVTVSFVNNFGCTASTGFEITQPDQLAVSLMATNTECTGNNIISNVNGGTPSFAYLWSDKDASTTPNLNISLAGTYSLTVTDADLCSASSSLDVISNAPLSGNLTSTEAICGSDNGSLSLAVSGGSGSYSYLWSDGATTQNLGSLVPGTYSVTVYDLNLPCTGSFSTTVNTTGAPYSITLNPSSEALIASSSPSSSLANSPDDAGYGWNCEGYLCLARSLIQFDLSTLPAGALVKGVNLSLYADPNSLLGFNGNPTFGTNNAGWLQRVTTPWSATGVTWNNKPAITTSHQTNIPQSIIPSENYVNVDVTQLVQDMMNNSNFGFMLMQQDELDPYNSLIFASGGNSNTSLQPTLQIFYIISPVTIVAAPSANICPGTAVTFTATVLSGGSQLSYQWQVNGTDVGTNSNIYSTASLSNGDVVTCQVTSGDPSSGVVTTTSNVITMSVGAIASNTGPYCAFDSVPNDTIPEDSIFLFSSPNSMSSYSWSGPNLFSSNAQNPSLPANGNGGIYTVTVTDANGCTSSASTNVIVNMSPVAIATNTGPYCDFETIYLSCGPNSMSSYKWSGQNNSTEQNPSFPASGNGGYYFVTVTDVNGCTGSAYTNVVVNASPNATASNTGPYCSSGEISLLSGPSGMSSYSWSGPNSYSSNGQNPSLPAAGNGGTYMVTMTAANGCTASASTNVTLDQTCGQFQTAIYFMDSLGNGDTIIIGFDSLATVNLNCSLGEHNIIDQPTVKDLDVRIGNTWLVDNLGFGDYYFQTKKRMMQFSPSDLTPSVPIEIEIYAKYYPLKVTWNTTQFNVDGLNASCLTSNINKTPHDSQHALLFLSDPNNPVTITNENVESIEIGNDASRSSIFRDLWDIIFQGAEEIAVDPNYTSQVNSSQYHLIFDDEFHEAQIDNSNWDLTYPGNTDAGVSSCSPSNPIGDQYCFPSKDAVSMDPSGGGLIAYTEGPLYGCNNSGEISTMHFWQSPNPYKQVTFPSGCYLEINTQIINDNDIGCAGWLYTNYPEYNEMDMWEVNGNPSTRNRLHLGYSRLIFGSSAPNNRDGFGQWCDFIYNDNNFPYRHEFDLTTHPFIYGLYWDNDNIIYSLNGQALYSANFNPLLQASNQDYYVWHWYGPVYHQDNNMVAGPWPNPCLRLGTGDATVGGKINRPPPQELPQTMRVNYVRAYIKDGFNAVQINPVTSFCLQASWGLYNGFQVSCTYYPHAKYEWSSPVVSSFMDNPDATDVYAFLDYSKISGNQSYPVYLTVTFASGYVEKETTYVYLPLTAPATPSFGILSNESSPGSCAYYIMAKVNDPSYTYLWSFNGRGFTAGNNFNGWGELWNETDEFFTSDDNPLHVALKVQNECGTSAEETKTVEIPACNAPCHTCPIIRHSKTLEDPNISPPILTYKLYYYNTIGQLLTTGTSEEVNNVIFHNSLLPFPNGIYIVKVTDTQGNEVQTIKYTSIH